MDNDEIETPRSPYVHVLKAMLEFVQGTGLPRNDVIALIHAELIRPALWDDPQARINLLQQSLQKYGRHHQSCAKQPCSCGFQQVWDGLFPKATS